MADLDDDLQRPDLARLGLHDLHVELGGKMVPFAGYAMPVQYPTGVMKEHLHTRAAAGLFDVSHMGQVILRPKGSMDDLARVFEGLMPVDVLGLVQGRQRYGLFTNDKGGILDDLMFTNRGDHLYLVVNAACKAADIAHMIGAMPEVTVEPVTDRALLALQGPGAEAALEALLPGVAALRFMDHRVIGQVWVSRSGYTGEDGFEISVPAAAVQQVADALVENDLVRPIGLGARDSLRLEAGLPLYGHDLDEQTSPVMADLGFALGKRRRAEGGFAGAERIFSEIAQGPIQRRIGFTVEGRQPVREGGRILDGEGNEVGRVTSGGFSPSLERPIGMGYVATGLAEPGTALTLEQRGKIFAASVSALPFVPNRYHRKGG